MNREKPLQKIEQMYTNCLAQGAYFVESDGVAAVIDPLRETEPYLLRAKEKGVKIKYIFETHFHADFVSGHLDWQKLLGHKSSTDRSQTQRMKCTTPLMVRNFRSEA